MLKLKYEGGKMDEFVSYRDLSRGLKIAVWLIWILSGLTVISFMLNLFLGV